MGVINHMAQYLSHMETGAAALFKAKEYAALIAEARSSNILIKLRIISECWMLLSHAYIIIGYTHLYLEHHRTSHMNKLLHLLHTLSSAVYSLHNMALKILNNGSNDGSNFGSRFRYRTILIYVFNFIDFKSVSSLLFKNIFYY
jgi:hypothetical protein